MITETDNGTHPRTRDEPKLSPKDLYDRPSAVAPSNDTVRARRLFVERKTGIVLRVEVMFASAGENIPAMRS